MWPHGYGLPNLFSCFRWLVCSFFFFPLESEAMRLPISGSPSKCIPNLLILNVLNSCPSKPQTFFLCNYQLGFYIEEVISGSDKLDVLYIHFVPLSDSISSYLILKELHQRSVVSWKTQRVVLFVCFFCPGVNVVIYLITKLSSSAASLC